MTRRSKNAKARRRLGALLAKPDDVRPGEAGGGTRDATGLTHKQRLAASLAAAIVAIGERYRQQGKPPPTTEQISAALSAMVGADAAAEMLAMVVDEPDPETDQENPCP